MKKIIIGLGNPLKRDDNIGNLVVQELSNLIKNNDYIFIQAETTPENFVISLQKHKPAVIYFIDAVDFEAKIGDTKVFDFSDIKDLNLTTTHTLPITLFKKYYKNIKLIGIKIKNADFGKGLTKELASKYENTIQQTKEILLHD